jgi:hypothetical protein
LSRVREVGGCFLGCAHEFFSASHDRDSLMGLSRSASAAKR